jgi:hypothetical protein
LDYDRLLNYLQALDAWRASDPTVPDLRSIYARPLGRIRARSPMADPTREDLPRYERAPDPSFLDQIGRDARTVE